MENSLINLTASLLFVFLARKLSFAEYGKLCVRVKKIAGFCMVAVLFSSVLFAASAFANEADAGGKQSGLFGDLIAKGKEIFDGLREIIYVVAGFGIIGVSVGGFFGNLNWKWLGAIVIGLMVIGLTGSIIAYVGGGELLVDNTLNNVTTTLK